MASESASSLEHYCQQIVGTDKHTPTDPARGTWVYALWDLFTAEDIAGLYNKERGEHANSVSVGRALIKAGALSLGQIKVNCKPERIIAIRDFERYRQLCEESKARVAEIYLSERRNAKF